MTKHVWESVSRGKDWRRDLWVCKGCGRGIFKRATDPEGPPTDDLLREIELSLDCDEERVRQVMES